MIFQVVEVRARLGGVDEDLVGLGLEFLVVHAAGPASDLLRPRDRDPPRWWWRREEAGGGPGGASGGRRPWRPCGPDVFSRRARRPLSVPVRVVAVVGVEPPQQPVVGGAEKDAIVASCSRASPRAGPSRSPAAGEFRLTPRRRGPPGARPPRSRTPSLGAARAQPAPSGVHIMNHPLPWGLRGGWCAGRPPRCVCYVLLTRAACLSLQITRSIDDIQRDQTLSFVRFMSAMPSTGNLGAGESRSRIVR